MASNEPKEKQYAYMMFEGHSSYTVEYDLRSDANVSAVITRLTSRRHNNDCQQLAPTAAAFKTFRWTLADPGSGFTTLKSCKKPEGTLTLALPSGMPYHIC